MISTGRVSSPQRVVLSGDAGAGKTTLASLLCPVDREHGVLVDLQLGSTSLDCRRVSAQGASFEQLRALLRSDVLAPYRVVVIDPATNVEDMALAWTLANVPHEKGGNVQSVEGYGFGKGYAHWYDTMMTFLADLDRLVERGKHVVLVTHAVRATVPNPEGEDYLRFEPRFYAGGKDGKNSTRQRVIEWADHSLFLGFDVNARKDGKATGGTTRTLHVSPTAAWISKSRTLVDDLPCEAGDATVWQQLGMMPAEAANGAS